jgi:hypothetical protein
MHCMLLSPRPNTPTTPFPIQLQQACTGSINTSASSPERAVLPLNIRSNTDCRQACDHRMLPPRHWCLHHTTATAAAALCTPACSICSTLEPLSPARAAAVHEGWCVGAAGAACAGVCAAAWACSCWVVLLGCQLLLQLLDLHKQHIHTHTAIDTSAFPQGAYTLAQYTEWVVDATYGWWPG